MSLPLTSLQLKKLGPLADMVPERFRAVVQKHGMDWTWEQAAPCPCVTVLTIQGATGATGEPRAGCSRCTGTGLVYHSAQPIRALSLSARSDPGRFAIYGEYAKGMFALSLLPEHLPGHLDRFTALDWIIKKDMHAVRQATVESLPAPIITRDIQTLGDPLDPTKPQPQSIAVVYMSKADAEGIAYGDPLVEGVDYAVTEDGKLDWSPGDVLGTAPILGDRYALTYHGNPSYLVLNHPHLVRATHVESKRQGLEYRDLPVQADCGLEFYQLKGL